MFVLAEPVTYTITRQKLASGTALSINLIRCTSPTGYVDLDTDEGTAVVLYTNTTPTTTTTGTLVFTHTPGVNPGVYKFELICTTGAQHLVMHTIYSNYVEASNSNGFATSINI